MVMDSLNLYKAKEIYITNDLYKYIKEVMHNEFSSLKMNFISYLNSFYTI